MHRIETVPLFRKTSMVFLFKPIGQNYLQNIYPYFKLAKSSVGIIRIKHRWRPSNAYWNLLSHMSLFCWFDLAYHFSPLKVTVSGAWRCLFLRCPPIAQSSGRFKTAHKGFYLSAKAYQAACDELSRIVHRFETALYGALFWGHSAKKDIPMLPAFC